MPDKSRTPVIVGAARTPIGKFLGALSPLSAPELGAVAIREALKRSKVPAEDVQEVIMGHVIQGGTGQAPARQAALKAGLPATVSAVTVNKVCGSGLKAVMLASQAIKAGDAQVIIAGGQESMSNAPYYVYGMRNGVKLSDQKMVDGMIKDGLWCASCDVHMGSHAEYTARKAGVTREEQDEFAAASHRKAVSAIEAGRFRNEIAPVQVPGKKGATTVDTDEGPRKDTTAETLANLRPAFPGKNGSNDELSVTAGNSSSLNDGAAALVVVSEEDLDTVDVARLGPPLRRHPACPDGANVNFVRVLSPNRIAVRTYERGVEAETLACGSGIVAAAAVVARAGLVDPPVVCETRSGVSFTVDFRDEAGGLSDVTLTGDAREVFTAELTREAFQN